MKGAGVIILASLLQSYACSGLCSVNLLGCEEEKNDLPDCCNMAVPLDATHNESESDCQEDHFVFLQTLGQFYSFGAIELNKIFPLSDYALASIFIKSEYTLLPEIEVFTGFVPPPPKDGIPIFIRSFLI